MKKAWLFITGLLLGIGIMQLAETVCCRSVKVNQGAPYKFKKISGMFYPQQQILELPKFNELIQTNAFYNDLIDEGLDEDALYIRKLTFSYYPKVEGDPYVMRETETIAQMEHDLNKLPGFAILVRNNDQLWLKLVYGDDLNTIENNANSWRNRIRRDAKVAILHDQKNVRSMTNAFHLGEYLGFVENKLNEINSESNGFSVAFNGKMWGPILPYSDKQSALAQVKKHIEMRFVDQRIRTEVYRLFVGLNIFE
jgi:hypothetical protein